MLENVEIYKTFRKSGEAKYQEFKSKLESDWSSGSPTSVQQDILNVYTKAMFYAHSLDPKRFETFYVEASSFAKVKPEIRSYKSVVDEIEKTVVENEDQFIDKLDLQEIYLKKIETLMKDMKRATEAEIEKINLTKTNNNIELRKQEIVLRNQEMELIKLNMVGERLDILKEQLDYYNLIEDKETVKDIIKFIISLDNEENTELANEARAKTKVRFKDKDEPLDKFFAEYEKLQEKLSSVKNATSESATPDADLFTI